ncbi:hypothetical protein BKA70DRAFT_1269431 [Coprinopsis sp. MPI-PUGE-AT-0042]|nr:hypothetical protein BKA70DRAFT_1269431 [Coprinopsis sp. MPI-PUGE-AT-0042]
MSLPLDLLCATAEQLGHDMTSLKALALTCKGLSDYCQRRIFSTIAANIVIGEGTWERGVFGQINLDALLAAVKDNRRLGSYVKHLFFLFDCDDQFFEPQARTECKLTKLEALRLHTIPSLTQDVDLSQTISIFQAISSLFISYISIRNLPFAPPASPAHLSRLELLSSPLKRAENAEHHLKPINLEWFSYLSDRSVDPQISTECPSLKAVRDSKAVQFSGLRHLKFGSRFNQDHHEAAQVLREAIGHLVDLIYCFPFILSGGGQHTSIPANLLHPERRVLFEQAVALRTVTFQISAEDINEDLAYRGNEWPRIFTWTIQSLTVLSGCPRLEEIRFQILDAAGPLFVSLSDDWRRLNALLVSGTGVPTSLKRVSISIEITDYETSEGEILRLRKERDDLAKDLFKQTHEKTGIVVNVFG